MPGSLPDSAAQHWLLQGYFVPNGPLVPVRTGPWLHVAGWVLWVAAVFSGPDGLAGSTQSDYRGIYLNGRDKLG